MFCTACFVLFCNILHKHPLTDVSVVCCITRGSARMGRGASWSPEDLAALHCYIEAGKGPAYVAAHRPDWSLSSIKKAMAKIRQDQVMGRYKGRKTKFDTPEIKEYLDERAKAGDSLANIQAGLQEKFGVSVCRSTVSRRLADRLTARLADRRTGHPPRGLPARKVWLNKNVISVKLSARGGPGAGRPKARTPGRPPDRAPGRRRSNHHQLQCVRRVKTFSISKPHAERRKAAALLMLASLKKGTARVRVHSKSPEGTSLPYWVFSSEKMFRLETTGKAQETSKKRLRVSGKAQTPPGVMVSLAVSQHSRIMSPCFLEPRCRTDSREYVKCLEDHYVVQLGSYPALKDNGFWVEDKAPSHNSRFTNAWKDKHWPIYDVRWPPNSPDLNPLDYSIWTQIEGRLQPSYPSKSALKAGRPTELSADRPVARPTGTGAPGGVPLPPDAPAGRPAGRPTARPTGPRGRNRRCGKFPQPGRRGLDQRRRGTESVAEQAPGGGRGSGWPRGVVRPTNRNLPRY